MKRIINLIMTGVMVGLMAYVSLAMMTVSHEKVHSEIYRHYGCQDIEIKYEDIYLTGFTRCNDAYFNETESVRILNAQTEIVGYHLITLMGVLWLIMISAVILIQELIIKNNK